MATNKNYKLLIQACENGNLTQVKKRMGRLENSLQYGYALDTAAHQGHVEIVQCLLPMCEQRDIDGVLINACLRGHTQVVACLVAAQALNDYTSPLQWASKYGHSKIVDILIPVSNPKADNSFALQGAVQHEQAAVVQQLIGHSDCQKVLKELKRNGFDPSVLENEMQKQRLLREVVSEKPVGVRKM